MKLNALCISPYQGMHFAIRQIYKEMSFNYPNINVYFEQLDRHQGSSELKRMLNKRHYSAIISRGGTISLIKENTNTMVIDIGVSQYDILRIIHLSSKIKDIALVGFPEITKLFNQVSDQFQQKITVYSINNDDELEDTLLDIKKSGIKTIIGDTSVENIAGKIGLSTIFITSSDETIREGLTYALNLLNVKNTDLEQIGILTNLLDSYGKFFVLYDQNKKLILNSKALLKNRDLCNKFNQNIQNNRRSFIFDDCYYEIVVNQYKKNIIYKLKQRHIWRNNKNNQATEQLILNDSKVSQFLNLYHIIFDDKFFSQLKSYSQDNRSLVLIGEPGMELINLSQFIVDNSINNHKIPILLNFKNLNDFENAINDDESVLYDSDNICVINKFNKLPYDLQKSFLNFIEETGFRSRNKLVLILEQKVSDGLSDSLRQLVNQSHSMIIKPLRDIIGNSIYDLTTALINYYSKYNSKVVTNISNIALDSLLNQSWDNNLSEFRKIMIIAFASCSNASIGIKDIEYALDEYKKSVYLLQDKANETITTNDYENKSLHEIIKDAVTNVLLKNNGNKTKTAKQLNISRATLWRYLKE